MSMNNDLVSRLLNQNMYFPNGYEVDGFRVGSRNAGYLTLHSDIVLKSLY